MSLIPANFGWRTRVARFNPIRNLTPATLAQSLDLFDIGYLRNAALLWEIIEDRDDILQIAAPKRRKAVSRREWQVETKDESAEAKAHAETLTEFFNAIRVTDAADENKAGGFRMLIRQMMNAVFHGYAVHEIVWKPAGGKLRAELRYVPLYFFENRTGRLRFIGPEGGVADGQELAENEWLITCGDSALMKAASICYIFKRLSLQDWLNLSEKFGIPGIHGETPAAHGSKEWNSFVDSLEGFANDWITATSPGAKINLIEAKMTGGKTPFEPMVERMDRRLTTLCRGADLSTMSRTNAVGASVQEGEEDILLEDDCELISEALNAGLARFVIQWTHGTDEPLAEIKLLPPQQKDVKTDIIVDQFLLDNGGELDAAETFSRYDREPADTMPEDAVLKKTAESAEAFTKGNAPGAMGGAANDAAVAGDGTLLQNALANALGVVPQWLAPIAGLVRGIEAKAADKTLSNEDVAAFAENAANRLPELFDGVDFSALADEIEEATGAAVLSGVAGALRKHKGLGAENDELLAAENAKGGGFKLTKNRSGVSGHWVTLHDGRHVFIGASKSRSVPKVGEEHGGKTIVAVHDQHPAADAKGRVHGDVVKETEKGILVKHEDREGWLQKRWTKPANDGRVSFDQKHLEKFEESEKTISGFKILRDSDKAMLVHHDGAEAWVPKSAVKMEADKMTMPKWVAQKFQPTHHEVSVDSITELPSGKAVKVSVDVSRPDGEPQSAHIILPKSQIAGIREDSTSGGSHRIKIPRWLKEAKEAEYETMHSGGGFTFHLNW